MFVAGSTFGIDVLRFAGKAIKLRVKAGGEDVIPAGTQVGFLRPGRRPEIVSRSPYRRSQNEVVLYCWVPRGATHVGLVDRNGAPVISPNVSFRCRSLSIVEIALTAAVKRPCKLLSIMTTIRHGNSRGTDYRFGRLTDELNALSYPKWTKSVAESFHPPPDHPPLSVIVTINQGKASDLRVTKASLAKQSFTRFREVDEETFGRSIESPTSKNLLWIRLAAGDRLAPDALASMVSPFANPDVAAVYSDEDRRGVGGLNRCKPDFKPAWDPLLAQSGWLSLEAAMFRVSMLPDKEGVRRRTAAELLLDIHARGTGSILHIPRILLHRIKRRADPIAAKKPAIRLKDASASIIIPTRDRVDLLKPCLDGLFSRTMGVTLDIIIVDNGSVEPATIEYLKGLKISGVARVIEAGGPFNFSRLCNKGVASARFEQILLLNNDVEPINEDWLLQMLQELEDPLVGAVGAYLLFPDGLVQHAGVLLGAGSVARHRFHFIHPRSRQHRDLLQHRRLTSAVTAACLLTRKSLWDRIGGMDEESLTVAFNDVDYCLKLGAIKKTIVWTPFAKLWHKESVSRGKDDTDAKLQRFAEEERIMYERWGAILARDPFFNPNQSLLAEEDVLRTPPYSTDARNADWSSDLIFGLKDE